MVAGAFELEFDQATAGCCRGELESGFGDTIEGLGLSGRDTDGRVELWADDSGEVLAEASGQAIQGELQAGALHDGGIELVTEVANTTNGGFEDLLDFSGTGLKFGDPGAEIEAEGVKL